MDIAALPAPVVTALAGTCFALLGFVVPAHGLFAVATLVPVPLTAPGIGGN